MPATSLLYFWEAFSGPLSTSCKAAYGADIREKKHLVKFLLPTIQNLSAVLWESIGLFPVTPTLRTGSLAKTLHSHCCLYCLRGLDSPSGLRNFHAHASHAYPNPAGQRGWKSRF